LTTIKVVVKKQWEFKVMKSHMMMNLLKEPSFVHLVANNNTKIAVLNYRDNIVEVSGDLWICWHCICHQYSHYEFAKYKVQQFFISFKYYLVFFVFNFFNFRFKFTLANQLMRWKMKQSCCNLQKIVWQVALENLCNP